MATAKDEMVGPPKDGSLHFEEETLEEELSVHLSEYLDQQAAPARAPAAGAAKSRIVAGILGILIGGFGIHKFYLGKVGPGIVYVLFLWTEPSWVL